MENENFKSTRRVILSRVVLVPFVAVMLVFGTLVYYFATNLRSQAQAKLARIADGHRQLVEQFLHERSSDLQFVAASNSFERLRHNGELAEVLEHLNKETGGAFFDLGVFDQYGNHVAYIGPYDLKGKNYAQAEWFIQVQQKNIYISDVFLGYRDSPHSVIAVRREEAGRSWCLRATIDTHFFNDLVESIRIGKTGEAYLVNRHGVLQTKRRSGGGLMDEDENYPYYQINESGVSSFVAHDRVGGRHLYAIGKLELTGWLLVVRQEVGEAYAPLIRAVLIAVGMTVAGGAVVVTMGFLLASSVAHQLTVAAMEKRQMGNQLIVAGKLAEVGEMSAGLAHEINNPLQVMKSEETLVNDLLAEMEADGALRDSENLRMVKDSINQIGRQVDRCKQITLGLLRFARQSDASIQTVDLQSFLREAIAMVERRAQVENVRIVQDLDPDLPKFQSDPSQLQQVFLNLLNNAMYALRGKDSGEVRITATRGEDNTVNISVADNGCGIEPENLEKIFLPFFTTKPVGQGTGLGLSTCYGIVERLGGQISVSSEVNVGTVFTVRLPLSGVPEEARGKLAPHV